jgi:hypothetical protein
MTGPVGIQEPIALRNFAELMRGAGRRLLQAAGAHPTIDPGPDGVFAALNDANERAHAAFSLYATDAYRGFGGMAYAADYIAIRLPAVDQHNADAVSRLGSYAYYGLTWPAGDQPRPDPRFVSPPAPR